MLGFDLKASMVKLSYDYNKSDYEGK